MAHFSVNFLSYELNRAVDINVILPTMCGAEMSVKPHTHKVEEPYPVLYLLHGGMNDYSTWERYTSIERYAEERRIAVVTFSAENKGFLDIDSGGFEDFLFGRDHIYTFATEELPDFVTNIFPISKEPAHTYIAGLSMGGIGTLTFALNHPERYRAVGVLSSMATNGGFKIKQHTDSLEFVPPEEDPMYKEKYDTLLLMKRRAEEGTKLPDIYTAMGDQDFGIRRYQAFLKEMDRLGIMYTYEIVPGYGHEWAFWDLEIQRFLDWLPRTDVYYRDNPKRRI